MPLLINRLRIVDCCEISLDGFNEQTKAELVLDLHGYCVEFIVKTCERMRFCCEVR